MNVYYLLILFIVALIILCLTCPSNISFNKYLENYAIIRIQKDAPANIQLIQIKMMAKTYVYITNHIIYNYMIFKIVKVENNRFIGICNNWFSI